jgi:peptidoglycan DL-endopeptidase CwlO
VDRKLRFVLLIAIAFAIRVPFARAVEEQEETLGDKLKHLFVRHSPTPTPKPKEKKNAPTPAAAKSPSAAPSESPISLPSPPERSATPTEALGETPTQSATPEIKPTASPENTPTQYFGAVRPITPHPGSRRSSPAIRTMPATQSTPFPTMTAMSEAPPENPAERPTPSLPPISTPPPPVLHTPEPPTLHPPPPALHTESQSPAATSTATASPPPIARKTPSAAISTDEIAESVSYAPEVRKIVDLSLDLTGRNLSYKYVSADPKNGGMDSSGFIYYVLTQSGVTGVPRDAREQYIWVRKAGNFQAVLAQRDDTFELDSLQPGDLLFWASNFGVSPDPEIMQTMIYLGRDKSTNQRLMVGASEAASPKGQKKSGVDVFEFKVGHAAPKPNQESGPVFVGYGRIPK